MLKLLFGPKQLILLILEITNDTLLAQLQPNNEKDNVMIGFGNQSKEV